LHISPVINLYYDIDCLIEPPILIGINCVLYEVCVYAGDACITVDLHESDKRNVLLKKAALDSQRQMLKLTNCLPMVGGSLRVLQLLAHLRMVAMI
jgi:hypothetical protein